MAMVIIIRLVACTVRLGGKTIVARGRSAHWPLRRRGEDVGGDDRDSSRVLSYYNAIR